LPRAVEIVRSLDLHGCPAFGVNPSSDSNKRKPHHQFFGRQQEINGVGTRLTVDSDIASSGHADTDERQDRLGADGLIPCPATLAYG
jgi:hypothetical protein